MAAPIDNRHGLALAFAEFSLLPDLVARDWGTGQKTVPKSWQSFLSGRNLNTDHVNEGDLPSNADLADFMALDAWRLANWLEFVSPGRMTTEGLEIISLENLPLEARKQSHEELLCEALARQIKTCYLTSAGSSIADLLQRGARTLASADHEWASYCPGLLLVEFQALTHTARGDPERASKLVDELARNRHAAMRVYGVPRLGATSLQNTLDYADAVTAYYIEDLRLSVISAMTLTETRATAMLFEFAGLLEEAFPLGPVNCLAPGSR